MENIFQAQETLSWALRDKRFVRSTNYEKLMSFLETRREERQRLGPEEIQDWSVGTKPGPSHSLIPRRQFWHLHDDNDENENEMRG